MGQEVAKIAKSTTNLSLAGGLSEENLNPTLEQSPDIIIDFSLPENLPNLISFAKNHNSCVVSGTTGFSESEFTQFKKLANDRAVFWSANMSFGVFLMCQLTQKLAQYNELFKFHVEETHHIHKKDKPSGTAIMVEEAAKKSTNTLEPTVSHREGEVFGIHRFVATSENESLEIRHEAFNRSLFAQGAVDAGMWLCQQKPGFYSMEDFAKQFES